MEQSPSDASVQKKISQAEASQLNSPHPISITIPTEKESKPSVNPESNSAPMISQVQNPSEVPDIASPESASSPREPQEKTKENQRMPNTVEVSVETNEEYDADTQQEKPHTDQVEFEQQELHFEVQVLRGETKKLKLELDLFKDLIKRYEQQY